MAGFLNAIESFNNVINDFIWVKIGIILLISTGIIMTVLTRFFQISHIGYWFKKTIGSVFNKENNVSGKHSISQFQALCTALAATIGVGNIAGVAAAIAIGGPGAVFWMWIAAFFGMMTGFSEKVLGIYYRRKNADGDWCGGPMYYLEDGLGSKKHCKGLGKVLAVIFSICAVLASFGIGNLSQANKIILNVESAFKIDALSSIEVFEGVSLYAIIIGAVLVIIAGVIIIGGLKRIAAFAEKVVPFMAILYIIGALVIIFANITSIGNVFGAIFKFAFSAEAVGGGALGVIVSKVITQGFKRGIFSNEAGLGSSVMAHSAAEVREPVKQGMWGIFEVFADTIIVCTLTALTVLSSGVVDLSNGAILTGKSDATLVADAFSTIFGSFGSMFVAIAIFLFAFTTIVGWSFYGTKSFEYLFGTKATIGYKIFFVLLIMGGAVMTSSLAWDISDTFNGMMMIPNLIGVLALSGTVMKITKNYVDRKLRGMKIPPMLSADKEIQKQMESLLDD